MRHFFAFFILLSLSAASQKETAYTHDDSLKGTYGPARAWWNVLHYDLHVTFNVSDSAVNGKNIISYQVLSPYHELQLDLLKPLILDSVTQDGKKLPVRSDGNAHFVGTGQQPAGSTQTVIAYYHGRPVQAKTPPWDGGVVWSRDKTGAPWISVACQGMAARVWFPNKDHMKDEPDSATMHFTVPSGLFAVSNGRFVGIMPGSDGTNTFTWKVNSPINNYNIIPYIGRYTVIKDTFNGKDGTLDLEYWVLQESFAIARSHFELVKPMLRCFEHWFGAYPFYKDGYKLVEAPYLGMEHQSGIAYGNEYLMGYKGRDLSGTGWGLKWDFIIVHESGHEWFGNNISAADVADNWIHEGFTAYSENLFTEYLFGKEAGSQYVRGTRTAVLNDQPVIAPYDVNAGGSLDVYYKASNMLHTIRQIVNNDSLWRKTLTALNTTFRHKTVTTREIEEFLKTELGLDLQRTFDQYLRTTQIPTLQYKIKNGKVKYRWRNCVKGFDMPVDLVSGETTVRVTPRQRWSKTAWEFGEVAADPDFFIDLERAR